MKKHPLDGVFDFEKIKKTITNLFEKTDQFKSQNEIYSILEPVCRIFELVIISKNTDLIAGVAKEIESINKALFEAQKKGQTN